MFPLKRTFKNSLAYIFTLSLLIIFPSHRYVPPLMKNKTKSKQKILKVMYFSKSHSIFCFHSCQLNIYNKESIPAAFILKPFISFVTHWTLSGVPCFTTCYLQLVPNPMTSIFTWHWWGLTHSQNLLSLVYGIPLSWSFFSLCLSLKSWCFLGFCSQALLLPILHGEPCNVTTMLISFQSHLHPELSPILDLSTQVLLEHLQLDVLQTWEINLLIFSSANPFLPIDLDAQINNLGETLSPSLSFVPKLYKFHFLKIYQDHQFTIPLHCPALHTSPFPFTKPLQWPMSSCLHLTLSNLSSRETSLNLSCHFPTHISVVAHLLPKGWSLDCLAGHRQLLSMIWFLTFCPIIPYTP